MTIADILLADFDLEIANTRRSLERVPEDRSDFKCHDKSMPLGKLAMHCASIPIFGVYIMEDAGMDMATSTRRRIPLVFVSRAATVALLEKTSTECRAALAGASDEHLLQLWPFTFGEQVIFNDTRLLAFRYMFLNHMVHHTAQLGVYLRLNDIPVPALYGPSADEQWSPA